jgi:general secretion pathway protein D
MKRKKRISWIYLSAVPLLLLMIAGCAPRYAKPINLIDGAPQEEKDATKKKSDKKKKKDKVLWVQQPIEKESILNATAKKGADYLMNFENISLPEFIEAMMSGVFKKNYLLTSNVKSMGQRFTIKMTEDLKSDRAFQLFKSILAMYNVATEKRENTYVFDQGKDVKMTLKGPLVYGRRTPERFPIGSSEEVTFMVPFHNISPDTIKPIIQSQLSSQALVFPIPGMNLLVINGSYEDVKYTLSFIELLDRAQFKDKSVVLITPEFWDIDDFEQKVKMLLYAEGVTLDAMDKNKSILFIPIEKLNSIIVISPVRQWVERVLYWLEKLDVPEAAGESKKVYSYRLKNVNVEAVAEILQAYRTGTSVTGYAGFGDNRRIGGGPLGGGTTSQGGKTGAKGTQSKANQSSRNLKTTASRRSGSSSGAMANEEDAIDQVSIIPVLETNSVVIVGTPVEYKKYLDILKRIDVPRNQVFVEVIIGEITLDKSTQLGLEFWINRYLHKTSFGTKGGLGVYKGTDESGNKLVPSGSNLFVDGTLPGTQFEVLINALMENSKINIVSTPKITVLENEEAEISVGSDVPVIASESAISTGATTGGILPFRSVQYINTGIILKVRASILADRKIALQIEQEISEALENKKSDISSPEILKRTIKTTLVVQEGEIAFIGGMFQNKLSTSGTGIPVLSKIPLLGNLFKSSKKQLKKTELVVFINSKTIRKNSDMKAIVDGVKKMFSDKLNMQNTNDVEEENDE